MTAGIVSASGRDIGSGPYDFLQIDAAVNRGNSGGPAVNLDGKVIGVNTAIYSPSGGSVGIAFAIPASTARDVVQKLKDQGKVSSGWLGVQIQNVDENIAESQGLKDAKGALVAKILPEGPAAKSELKSRDIIEQVNGKAVSNSRELARTIAALAPGSDAHLHIFRNGEERDITVKLGEFPNNEKVAALGRRRMTRTKPAEKELGGLGPDARARARFSRQQVEGRRGCFERRSELESGRSGSEARRHHHRGQRQSRILSPTKSPTASSDARDKGRKNVLLQVRSRDQQRFLALPIEPKSDAGKDQDTTGQPRQGLQRTKDYAKAQVHSNERGRKPSLLLAFHLGMILNASSDR